MRRNVTADGLGRARKETTIVDDADRPKQASTQMRAGYEAILPHGSASTGDAGAFMVIAGTIIGGYGDLVGRLFK